MGPRHGIQSCPLSIWVSLGFLPSSNESPIQALPSGFLRRVPWAQAGGWAQIGEAAGGPPALEGALRELLYSETTPSGPSDPLTAQCPWAFLFLSRRGCKLLA